MNIFITIITLLLVPTSIYILVIIRYHDWDVPTINPKYFDKYKNILITFPHPDDETMSVGGLIHKLAKKNNTTVLSLTKGELGNELVKVSPEELGQIREKEFSQALLALGSSKNNLWDLGDGQIQKKYEEVKQKLRQYIQENKFDLVITYERMGIYGHRDHVAESKILTELSTELGVEILYVTIGKKVAKKLNLHKYIKNLDLDVSHVLTPPEFKLPIYSSLINKYRAAKKYKSQNLSHQFPLWVTIFFDSYEYFTTKYPK